jgi:hypothetical protein
MLTLPHWLGKVEKLYVDCVAGLKHASLQLCREGKALPCPAYMYAECSDTGCPDTCTPCEPGYACRGGQRYLCEEGSYSDGTAGRTETQHAATSIDVSPVSEYCHMCEAGTFQNATGQVSCDPCPAGHYSSSKKSRCDPCPVGTYSSGQYNLFFFRAIGLMIQHSQELVTTASLARVHLTAPVKLRPTHATRIPRAST